jgi:D-serine dehydratase
MQRHARRKADKGNEVFHDRQSANGLSKKPRCPIRRTEDQLGKTLPTMESLMLLNDPQADVLLDAATKGIPIGPSPLRLRDVAAQGWNVLAGDCPLPLAVIRTDIMAANSAWMMAFASRHGLLLAPHGKTTMAPALFAQQLADGAWAITVATSQQMQVCLRAGIRRIILANQPMGKAVDACFAALAAHADLELYVLADSLEGVDLLANAPRSASAPALRVLVEVGAAGARTGCRDVASALAVATAIDATPGLTLAGVEAFEGVLPDTAAVSIFMQRVVETAIAIDSAGLFSDVVMLSAGGSAFFDLVALGFQSVQLSRPLRRVLRSGCYLTHDEFGLAKEQVRMLRERRVDLPEGSLRAALEVWSYVQSRPDPDKAILTVGKRDIGYDTGWPQPVAWYRPGVMQGPVPMPAGCTITGLNDQHAHMSLPPAATLAVGDMVAIGIAHPCTTFERWKVLMLVDAQLNVVGAIRTFF